MSEPIATTHDDLVRVLSDAIGRNFEIPEEFEPFVQKYLPPLTASSARFLRRGHPVPHGAFGPIGGDASTNEGAGAPPNRQLLGVPPGHPLEQKSGPHQVMPNLWRGLIDPNANRPKVAPTFWWQT